MAALELKLKSEKSKELAGNTTVQIPGGKNLIIETTPGGVEIMNIPIPTGKSWNTRIQVNVSEIDA